MVLTAAELGTKLLDEVEVVGLDEFLQYLGPNRTASYHLNVPAIDRLIDVFHETTSRVVPPVIEIASTTPGSGKTHLLYYIVAATVLPIKNGSDNATFGAGKGAAAVIVDMDGRFDVERLGHIMQSFLTGSDLTSDKVGMPDEPSGVDSGFHPSVMTALQHVHIMQPQSLAATVATVEHLPSYLLDLKAHSSGGREIGLLALDGVAAFYWQDKHAEESSRFAVGDEPSQLDELAPTVQTTTNNYARLAAGIRNVQRAFHCPVLTTSWSLSPAPSSQQNPHARPLFRPLLPPAWQGLATVRLCVAREAVTRYPPGIGVSGARRDADARARAVAEGRFTAWVNRWGEESWHAKARAELSGGGSGGFGFRIREAGVWLEDVT